MAKTMKSWLQILMKLFNFFVGMAGMTMIMYGLWLIKVWQSDTEESYSDHQILFPWFIHAFIGLGISLCAITCLGHFAAHTAYSHFLSCYIPVMSLLIFVETVMMAHTFLNDEWEKDLGNDPSGRFKDFRDYMESNMDICKWVGVSTVIAQGVSISLATIMKTMKIDMDIYYDIEADSSHPHLPYLNTPLQQLPTLIGGPYFAFEHYL